MKTIISIYFVFVVGLFAFWQTKSYDNHREIAARGEKSLPAKLGLFRRLFLSLDTNKTPYSGLIHKTNHDGEYVRRGLGKFLQKADSLARDDFYNPEAGAFADYYTFLLGTLIFPFHESRFIHATKRDPSYCYFLNDGLNPKNAKDFTKNYYSKELKKVEADIKRGKISNKEMTELEKKRKSIKVSLKNGEYLKDHFEGRFYNLTGYGKSDFERCSFFKTEHTQLLFGFDYADAGIMMINGKAHPSFYKRKGIFDFDTIVDYGLKYYYDGFNELASNPESYSCLKGLSEKDRRLLNRGLDEKDQLSFPRKLLSRAWAGKYNSGRVSQSCRKNHANDKAFTDSVKRVIDQTKSTFHIALPKDSVERKAFFELLNNVKKHENNRTYLDIVLKTDYNAKSISYDYDPIVPVDKDVLEQEELSVIETQPVQIIEQAEAVINILNDPTQKTREETRRQTARMFIELEKKSQKKFAADFIKDWVAGNVDSDYGVQEMILDWRDGPAQVFAQDVFATHMIPESDGDLPKFKDEDFDYIVKAFDSNIRTEARVSADTKCGNTGLIKQRPLKVKVLGEESGYFKVSLQNLESAVNDKCLNREFVYIYAPLLEKIRKYNVIMRGRTTKGVSLRNIPGMSRSIKIDSITARSVEIVEEHFIGQTKKYIWYAIIYQGRKLWFYSGVDGESSQAFERD